MKIFLDIHVYLSKREDKEPRIYLSLIWKEEILSDFERERNFYFSSLTYNLSPLIL